MQSLEKKTCANIDLLSFSRKVKDFEKGIKFPRIRKVHLQTYLPYIPRLILLYRKKTYRVVYDEHPKEQEQQGNWIIAKQSHK